jgi:hypothetical protein
VRNILAGSNPAGNALLFERGGGGNEHCMLDVASGNY